MADDPKATRFGRVKARIMKDVRAQAVLRDVHRSGGTDGWDHLRSHGHSAATVRGCVTRGELLEGTPRRYQITDAGLSKVCTLTPAERPDA